MIWQGTKPSDHASYCILSNPKPRGLALLIDESRSSMSISIRISMCHVYVSVCVRERVCVLVCQKVRGIDEIWMSRGWFPSPCILILPELPVLVATNTSRSGGVASIPSFLASIPSFLPSWTVAWCRCCTTFVMCVRMATCVGLLCFVCMYILYTVSIQPTLRLLDKVRGLKVSCLANWCNLTVFGRYNVSTISEWYRYILENTTICPREYKGTAAELSIEQIRYRQIYI